jgi:hypothetical protein
MNYELLSLCICACPALTVYKNKDINHCRVVSDVSFGKVKILIQDEDILFGGKPRSKNVTKNVHFSLFNQSCVFQWYTHPSFHFSECLFYISLSLFFALVAIFLREGLGVPEGSSLLAKNVSTLLTLINNWKTIRFICFPYAKRISSWFCYNRL